MIVVSNASPLITLSRANLLFVFEKLFTTVNITQEVCSELSPHQQFPNKTLIEGDWLKVHSLSNPLTLSEWLMKYHLGKGELSTILFAKECNANITVIDERKARVLAKSMQVPVIGTIGILETAYRRGIISDLKSVYDKLLNAGMYVDPRIIENSLKSVEHK